MATGNSGSVNRTTSSNNHLDFHPDTTCFTSSDRPTFATYVRSALYCIDWSADARRNDGRLALTEDDISRALAQQRYRRNADVFRRILARCALGNTVLEPCPILLSLQPARIGSVSGRWLTRVDRSAAGYGRCMGVCEGN